MRDDLVLDLLTRAEHTFKDRSAVYGRSDTKYAAVMKALFPDGVVLKEEEDWVRFGLLTQIVSKLCRYSSAPGHTDSIHDNGIYSFMLEAHDIRAALSKQENPRRDSV